MLFFIFVLDMVAMTFFICGTIHTIVTDKQHVIAICYVIGWLLISIACVLSFSFFFYE